MCYWLEFGNSAFQEVTEIKTACHSRGPTDKTQPLGRKGGAWPALAITKQVRPLSVAMRIIQQGHSGPVSASGCQLHNRLAECGDQVYFLPPKRTSWRLRSQAITDRQRGEQEEDCPLKAGASAETGGIAQVKGGCGGEVSTGYAECSPSKLWSCTDPPQLCASSLRTSHMGSVL